MSQLNLGDSLILDTDYSTSEKKTGATWIDGKPIYRKTIPVIAPSVSGTASTTAHNISDIDWIIKFEGTTSTSAGLFFPVNMPAGSSQFIQCQVDKTAIYLITNIPAVLSRDAQITVFYTKTTD